MSGTAGEAGKGGESTTARQKRQAAAAPIAACFAFGRIGPVPLPEPAPRGANRLP